MGRKRDRPPKLADPMPTVIQCVEAGRYRYSHHALTRLEERRLTRMEIRQALQAGHHVP